MVRDKELFQYNFCYCSINVFPLYAVFGFSFNTTFVTVLLWNDVVS